MRDRDVRKALHNGELAHFHEDGDSLVIEELGLVQGDTRVDIAVVNGFLHGYEIKSDRDTLERLPHQIELYSRVLDRITLVVGEAHVKKAANMIPDFWGIMIAQSKGRLVVIHKEKNPVANPSVDPMSLAKLLWKNEAHSIIEKHGLGPIKDYRPRKYLWNVLVNALDLPTLSKEVRTCVKARGDWRADRKQH